MGGSGSNISGTGGVYGTLGTPDPANIPGGRYGSATWTDTGGNFWLFGGFYANDLWKFSPSTNEWTWEGGSGPATILPAVYGTLGVPSTGNLPGNRYDGTSWTDKNGNFWLYGGYGVDANLNAGFLNDLWEFNPGTLEWTWVSGSNSVGVYGGQFGVYGTLGLPAAANVPGGRAGATGWADNNGKFWIFGGTANTSSDGSTLQGAGGDDALNDLWEFDPATKQWAWMGGNNTACSYGIQSGVYGTLGTLAAANIPSCRVAASGWKDTSGNFWLFGGQGRDIAGFWGDLNNYWKFTPSTNKWAWMGGDSTINLPSGVPSTVYGTLGTPAPGNIPGGRNYATSWNDNKGNLWLFGGLVTGFEGDSGFSEDSDLWQFNPATNEWAWMGVNQVSNIVLPGLDGIYGTLGVPAPGNFPGPRSASAGWADNSGNLWLFGGGGFLYSINFNDLWVYQPSTDTLPTTSTPTFSLPAGTYPGPQQVVISDTTNGAIIYYTTDGTTPTPNSIRYYSPVTIPISQTLKAYAVASGCFDGAVATAVYTLPPQAPAPTFSVPSGVYTSFQTVTISDAVQGATIYYTTDRSTPTTSSTLYSGPITIVTPYTPMEAIAIASGYSASIAASANYMLNLPTAVAPTFSLGSGTYTTPQMVTISDVTQGATIHYTTNGTMPTATSAIYSAPIAVSASESIWAMATVTNYFQSTYASATYTINPLAAQTATPVFTLPTGTYSAAQSVAILDATPNAAIFYTVDGTTPTTNSTQYTGTLTFTSSQTLQAIAIAYGDTASAVASATYTINLPQAATPTFSVPAGAYAAAQSVAISDTTAGTIIYFTTNGTAPSTGSAIYTGPITVSSTQTLQAIAMASGYSASNVASAAYTISLVQGFAIAGTAINLPKGAVTGNTSTITFTPSGGFTGTIILSCAIAPVAANAPALCSIPALISISGSSPQTTTLAVYTTAATAALNGNGRHFWPSVGGALLACILLVGIPARRKRLQSILAMLVLLLSITCGVFACGGSGSGGGGSGSGNPGTTAGNYTITVTGISGAISGTGKVSLTVQ